VLSKEVILVSAHYDHVGVTNGVVYPGADDNGSGSMGLLALAEALAEYGPMRRSVMLLWVSGEEKGLWGSAAWTRSPTLPAGHRAVCDLNIDMIGRNAPDYLLITPTSRMREYNGLTRLAEGFAPQEGFAPLGSADEYWRRSDHMNFADNLRIPVAFLFSDVHEDYHKPGDTPDKIDHDKIRRVVRLVLRMIDALQSDKLEL
jgi:Zn-dependent M28 family amino/carboxypeptidase